jgi:hypothetical protein
MVPVAPVMPMMRRRVLVSRLQSTVSGRQSTVQSTVLSPRSTGGPAGAEVILLTQIQDLAHDLWRRDAWESQRHSCAIT